MKKIEIPQETVSYKPFGKYDGYPEGYSLYPWVRDHVAILTPTNNQDEKIMRKILKALDGAWEFYYESTGEKPKYYSSTDYNGRMTIAVVQKTCGAGCGYVGWQGIEMMDTAWNSLYNGVKDEKRFSQVPFYELGRNFWFYGKKLSYLESPSGNIATGYAVFMRFMSMKAVNVDGLEFRDAPFKDFRKEVKSLVVKYENDANLNWENTLKIGEIPSNSMGLSSADFFASFMFELESKFGNKFIKRIWKRVGEQPDATNTEEASDNFIVAASLAAKKDLTEFFEKKWKWPVHNIASVKQRITDGLKK